MCIVLLLLSIDKGYSSGLFAREGSPVGTKWMFDIGLGYASPITTSSSYYGTSSYKSNITNFHIGAGYDLFNLYNVVVFNLKWDIGYIKWSTTNALATQDATFTGFTGLRLIIPITSFLLIYGDAGLGYASTDFSGSIYSSSSSFGFVPGGGIEFLIPIGRPDPNLAEIGEMSSKHVTQLIFGTLFRYYLIKDQFYTITVYTGLRW